MTFLLAADSIPTGAHPSLTSLAGDTGGAPVRLDFTDLLPFAAGSFAALPRSKLGGAGEERGLRLAEQRS
jgi:hypothetical protein